MGIQGSKTQDHPKEQAQAHSASEQLQRIPVSHRVNAGLELETHQPVQVNPGLPSPPRELRQVQSDEFDPLSPSSLNMSISPSTDEITERLFIETKEYFELSDTKFDQSAGDVLRQEITKIVKKLANQTIFRKASPNDPDWKESIFAKGVETIKEKKYEIELAIRPVRPNMSPAPGSGLGQQTSSPLQLVVVQQQTPPANQTALGPLPLPAGPGQPQPDEPVEPPVFPDAPQQPQTPDEPPREPHEHE